ncbi:MAG: ATP-binding protein [Chitinophagales bacterium]|nr:ATP-binding protein [Chitinophagales bacterium]
MQQITDKIRKEVQEALALYVRSYSTQRAAAESLNDVSEATLIQIKNGEWKKIGDNMWRNIAKQLGIGQRKLKVVETLDMQTMFLIFDTAKEEGATFALVGGAGFGKSTGAKTYASLHRQNNAFYIECREYWNKKTFLSKVLQAMGRSDAGMNAVEMMEAIVREVRRMHQPVLLMDEVDKLPDPVLKFFITFYNELNGMCGFVWLSTNNIEKRMARGLATNKNGYQELWSRIGSRFVKLNGASNKEIELICKENEITDPIEINTIINEANGDLRRVERNFLKNKLKSNRKNLKAA